MSEAKSQESVPDVAVGPGAAPVIPAVPASRRSPPRAPGLPLLGNAPEMMRDPLRFLTRVASELGDVVELRLGRKRAFLLNHPELAKRVLADNVGNYIKTERQRRTSRSVLGEGLLNSSGDFWMRQRRIAQPLFHKHRIAGFAETFARYTQEMIGAWASRVGQPFNAMGELGLLTMRIASKTLFSIEGAHDEVGPAAEATSIFAYRQSLSAFPIPELLPLPMVRRVKAARRTLDRVVMGLIAERRRSGGASNDLLAMLTAARDEETGEGMTDKQLRDEVMTFYLAGHETTANTLAWTLYLLATHPLVQRAVREEARAVLGDRLPAVEDLPNLPLTARVLNEAMRLYPPGWIMPRQLVRDDELGGYAIPGGTVAFVVPYVLHRDPRYWEDPAVFDPDRFLPEREKQRPRYAYLPFSMGQRQCIGASFALMEMQVVLPMLLRAFQVELAPGAQVTPEAVFTLRPKHGVPVVIRPA